MAFCYLLIDKVVLDVDIFDSAIELVVLGQGDSSLIVAIDNCGTETRVKVWVDLFKESLKPYSLFSGIGLADILGFI
jgi:hypothetical protein